MALLKPSASEVRIPEGYLAVPLQELSPGPALRWCVVTRKTPDPAQGHLVRLYEAGAATVYLGCIIDAAGRPVEWIELWVQNPANLAGSPTSYMERVHNDLLDQRWAQLFQAFRELAPQDCLITGYEDTPPAPACFEPARGRIHMLADATAGKPWQLCRDDALLKQAGLPPYSGSASRYLYQPDNGAQTKFIPVMPGSPESAATTPLAQAVRDAAQLQPFNAQAGLLLARRLAPIPLDAYTDLLGGKPWSGLGQGKEPLALGGVYGALQDAAAFQESNAYLFSGPHGPAGRFVETFHLKLQALTEALRQVRTIVQRLQLPFLNLSAESFRVKLHTTGNALPYLWTTSLALAKPSQALALPLQGSEFRYFLAGKNPHPFIYLPEGIGNPQRGECTARIRQVLPPAQGGTVVEGTFMPQEQLTLSSHDLLWLRIPLASGGLDLYGHVYSEEGMARGEARFRTLPMAIAEANRTALNAAAGVAMSRTPFEIVPLLSTPCDLYSLGVLAVRMLLVNQENTLAIALDEVLSLARQAGTLDDGPPELRWRIRSLFDRDPRWKASLGPHRLSYEKMDPADAAGLIPLELWEELLSILVRWFPGMSRDSHCKDFGDARALALETVFDEPLSNLEKLLLRTRSLMFIDWKQNREIHAVIQPFLDAARKAS